MTDINSKPDENGVHMCDILSGVCECHEKHECPDDTHFANAAKDCVCYPAMVRVVAALRGLITCDSKANSGNHWVDRLAEARKALSND